MVGKISGLLFRYRGLIVYGFFGICTTLVNVISYSLCAKMLDWPTVSSTVIAWIVAVLFAYITNRIWVFESEERTVKGIWREIVYFITCRLATGFMDIAFMYVFVDIMLFNDVIIKVFSNILVIVINYIASKLLIFKRRD